MMTYARRRVTAAVVFTALVLGLGGRAAAVTWTNSYTKALAEAKSTGKPILANCTGSDWCGWCWKLRDEVFKTPAFEKWAAERVVLLEVDFPKRKRQPRALRVQNQRFKAKYGVGGFPTILFLDSSGKVLGRSGYRRGGAEAWIKNAERFLPKPSKPADPEPSPGEPASRPAVFLGSGPARGKGAVVQLDLTGKVVGTLALPGGPRGLAVQASGLIAAIRYPPRIVRIDAAGAVKPLLVNPAMIASPMAVAAAPKTGAIVFADRRSAALYRIPAKGSNKPVRLLALAAPGGRRLDRASLAIGKDGRAILGTDAPAGVYRFAPAPGAALGDPVLKMAASVAADPASTRWAAAFDLALRVHEGDKKPVAITYPFGLAPINQAVAFGPDGVLYVALADRGGRCHVLRADLEAKALKPLLTREQPHVASFAVGRRMPWKR